MIKSRWWAFATLVAIAFIWGLAFVFQRVSMSQIGPFAFSSARFFLASLVLGCIVLLVPPGTIPGTAAIKSSSGGPSTVVAGLILGLLLFTGSALQQIGLVSTTAGKGGFITGLYVVFVPLLLLLFWRQPVRWNAWLGVIVAASGLYLLSISHGFELAPGDGWVLAGAVAWAFHLIAVGRLSPGRDPLRLALIQYLVSAVLGAVATLLFETVSWYQLLAILPALLYTGVVSIGVGHTAQVIAQRYTPPTPAALILSLETVFAALAGWVFLSEQMSPRMLAGACLMLLGIIVSQLQANSSVRRRLRRAMARAGNG